MKKALKITALTVGGVAGLLLLAFAGFVLYMNYLLGKSGCRETWEKTDGRVVTDLRYAAGERNTYDLYLPASAVGRDSVGVMLFIHGGAWVIGNKNHISYACKRFAKMGYVTASMNYTLAGVTDRRGTVPLMLYEVEQCIASIRNELHQRGLRPSCMALCGWSSGGHLAMLYAYKLGHRSAIPIAFVAQRVGPTDLSLTFPVTAEEADEVRRSSLEGKHSSARRELDNLLYAASGIEPTPDLYRKAAIDSLFRLNSPIHYLDRYIPTVFAYGENDILVHIEQARQFVAACDSLGLPYDYVHFPHSGHMLSDDPGLPQQFTAKVRDYARKYFGY